MILLLNQREIYAVSLQVFRDSFRGPGIFFKVHEHEWGGSAPCAMSVLVPNHSTSADSAESGGERPFQPHVADAWSASGIKQVEPGAFTSVAEKHLERLLFVLKHEAEQFKHAKLKFAVTHQHEPYVLANIEVLSHTVYKRQFIGDSNHEKFQRRSRVQRDPPATDQTEAQAA